MPGYTQAYQQTVLDWAHPVSANGDYIGWSLNGSTETSLLARTFVGATGWAAATAATPSVKANNAILTSAAATGAGTVGYFAVFNASTAGVQKTDWQALDNARAIDVGTTLQAAVGALKVTLN